MQHFIGEAKWPPLNSINDWAGKKFDKIEHPILWKLNKKISMATNLVTDVHGSTTEMQVTSYGLGGLCQDHMDSYGVLETEEEILRKRKPNYLVHGDILGTFMAWLSDTGAGGGTSFLNSENEKLVMPKKGAALFWYNLYSDGSPDPRTKHAGCPVLKGSKWIMNKWMHSYDNFKKFKCGLFKYDEYARPLKFDHFY